MGGVGDGGGRGGVGVGRVGGGKTWQPKVQRAIPTVTVCPPVIPSNFLTDHLTEFPRALVSRSTLGLLDTMGVSSFHSICTDL